MKEIRSGFIDSGTASLSYELAGEGQPVVLIHAGVADSRQWNNEFASLTRDFRVLRYDLRGYGKSLPVEGEFSHLRDLVTLLDRLDLHQPLVLIGCSMGGGLAMDFALAYPERVKALVMVGAGPSGLQLDAPPHPSMAEAEEAYNAGNLDRLAELEARIWFDGMDRSPESVNQEMRGLAIEMNRLALDHDAKRLGKRLPDLDPSAAGRLSELRIPVLVIIGEHDIPYLQAAADHMLEKIATARKVVILDAAHLPNMDHPRHFLREVRPFLDEVVE